MSYIFQYIQAARWLTSLTLHRGDLCFIGSFFMQAVRDWLTVHGLEKYASVILDNEVDTMDVVFQLSPDDLKDMGLSVGGRHKLLQAIAADTDGV